MAAFSLGCGPGSPVGSAIVSPWFSRWLLGFYSLVLEARRLTPHTPVARNEFLELRLKRVDVSRLQAEIVRLELHCDQPESLSFAWYLYRDGDLVEKYMYQTEPTREISLPDSGSYRVRCFVKDEHERKVSFYVKVPASPAKAGEPSVAMSKVEPSSTVEPLFDFSLDDPEVG